MIIKIACVSKKTRILASVLLFSCCVVFSQETEPNALDSIYARQAKLYRSKDYRQIIELSNYARSIDLNSAKDSLTFARITAYIGYANNKLNDFYSSIEGFKLALTYIPEDTDKGTINTKYSILYDLMTRYYSLRRYKKALSTAQKAEELLVRYNYYRPSRQTWLFQRKFRIYSALGFHDKAKLEVEKIRQKLVSITNESDESMRSGWMRYYRSDLLANYNEVLFIKEETQDYETEIEPLKQQVFYNMAQLDSIYTTTESLQNPKSRTQVSNLSLYVGALYYMSDFYKELEDYEKALEYINKTLSLSQKAREPSRNVTEFLRFKANVINELGDAATSLELLSDIEAQFNNQSYNTNELLTFRGDVYTKLSNLDSVVHYYKEALKVMHNSEQHLNEDLSNFSSRYQFPNDCRQIQHMSNFLIDYFPDNKEALEQASLFNNVAYNEFLNNHNNLDLNKGNKQLYYDILNVKLRFSTNGIRDKEAFVSNLENISNRLAWQQFSQSRNLVQLPIIDSLERIEYTIRKQLLSAKKERQQKQVDSLQQQLSRFQDSVNSKFPTISDFTQDTFEIKEFQQQLNNDEIVLKYLFFGEQFVVFQISNEHIQWELKPWTKNEQKLLSSHLEAIKNPRVEIQKSSQLTNLLMPKSALNYDVITVIPDQPIYFLPFETLTFESAFIVESKAIKYSSHLRFVHSLKEAKDDKVKATIFAPNYANQSTKMATRSAPVFLEGAQKEAEVLESLFPSRSFIGNSATKDNFISFKSDGNILHMAMHATLDEDNPGFSHFQFSKDEKLFLEELYALKIPADLAVLSACNTAVGAEDASLSINSLHRSFNYAGTKATVASLWEVPDETTSQIMIAFYQNLKEGFSKSTSLQLAKKDYLEMNAGTKLSHPYYWAGFVLYGVDDPVVNSSLHPLWYAIVVICILTIIWFLRARLRKN